MRKRIAGLLASMLLLLPLAACGDEEEEIRAPEFDYLGSMAEANTNEELVDDYGRMGSDTVLTYADGSTETIRRYVDDARYYEEGSGYWIIDEGDRYYSWSEETDEIVVSLFVAEAHEEKLASEQVTSFTYRPELETVIFAETVENAVTVRTVITDPDTVAEAAEQLGYEPGQVTELHRQYVIGVKSHEIQTTEQTVVLENGKEKPAAKTTVEIRPEEFIPDEEIEEQVFGEKMRSVNVVVDPMEEDEQIFRFRPPQGTRVELVIPESYDRKLYMDEACTEPFREREGPNGFDQNFIIFAKSRP